MERKSLIDSVESVHCAVPVISHCSWALVDGLHPFLSTKAKFRRARRSCNDDASVVGSLGTKFGQVLHPEVRTGASFLETGVLPSLIFAD